MAIRKEEEKKNGMKVTDNMDGEKKANNKLMAKYEPGVFSLTKYNKYKKALREDNVKEIFPDEDIFELRRMYDMYMKETGGKIND
jgi:ASC-1-like (ASCH) protein|tara:strand:+ start:153 stop:407 length:255 start_codon:yes stop_codon:yes gene_type:complete